jgi:N-methylhydantoinase A/oxoprolinase/acetone carboxylase beta subunit
MRIGVDAGGTFTDFVALHDDGRLETFKLRSDPRSPAAVILEGLRHAAGRRRGVDVVHGSTVATNALLERKGARTAFVTTAGFEDLLEIGRQNRAELYNLTPPPRRVLVPRSLCLGVEERVYHDGTVARRPQASDLKRLAARIRRAGVQAVGVCFLHAYRNPANERAVARALAGSGVYVCTSHQVSPEFREYERGSTTAVNAYVGPLMEAYLRQLAQARAFRISIMQSNGGFLEARHAARQAVRSVLSGPAGGVVGALFAARRSGFRRVLGFDMGGTSTDVSLADGAPRETTEAIVDGCPIRIPMLDIHTVGAGGGSIARVDAGGLLRVGPESAGANPGPACYGTGDEATVTDAHVVLGRIDALLGGTLHLDRERAEAAVDRLAQRLKTDRTTAAAGILRVANANMERAIRVVTVERGYDPREFAMVAFGGCGGLHACELGAELGARTVIVPAHAGALSALGMLAADAARDYAAGALGRGDIDALWAGLERQARRELPGAKMERSADMRYRGQSYELNVPWRSRASAERLFHREHAKLYGYSHPRRPVELVTLRLRARVHVSKPRLHRGRSEPARPEIRQVWTGGSWRPLPVWNRASLSTSRRSGPALVRDYGSTTLIPAGWRYRIDPAGNLIIEAGV